MLHPFSAHPPRRFHLGTVLVSATPEGYAAEAAAWIAARRRALGRSGSLPVTALSGGSTPEPIYRQLARLAADDPGVLAGTWIQVDERDVPLGHPASNQRMIRETLLAGSPAGVVFLPVPRDTSPSEGPGGSGSGVITPPAATAARYEARLRECRGGEPGPADLVLLGVGQDGHTASLFPGTPWDEGADGRSWVAWVPGGQDGLARFTLTLAALRAARERVFLVTGAAKTEIVTELLSGRGGHLPAAAVSTPETSTWILDPPAATGLVGLGSL